MPEYIEKCTIVNRLIDLENELQQYKPFHGFEHAMYRKICEAEIAIGKTTSADVAPVRHGQWIEYTKVIIPEPYNKWEQAWKCSECGFDDGFVAYNYCPNCGAKMDGKSNVPRTEGE